MVTIKSTAVEHTLCLPLWCVGRLEEQAGGACCRVSHAEAPRPSRHLFTPPGTRQAKTAGLFWRSAGQDRADMGVQDGGMGLQMGRSRLGVDGAGRGERGTVGVLL